MIVLEKVTPLEYGHSWVVVLDFQCSIILNNHDGNLTSILKTFGQTSRIKRNGKLLYIIWNMFFFKGISIHFF